MAGLIDLNDRKILYELDLNSRQTNKGIAKRVRLSEQVVGNRIKRLMDLGIIEYFFVKTNPSLLGYIHIKVYLRLHNIIRQKEDELINEINSKKGVFWLSSLRGKYDLVVSVYVKNIADFSKAYDELFGKWGNYILERNIIVLEKAFTFSKAYLLPKKESEEIVYIEGKKITTKLDEIDEGILRILNKEGRKQLIDIAKELKVSSDTIRYRINNLKKQGIITGFGVKTDFRKLDLSFYTILLKLQNMNNEKYKKLKTLGKSNRNTITFIKTIGDHDVELEIETTDKEGLDDIMKLLRDNFVSEIKDYEIIEVIREHRMTYYPF